MGNFGGFQRVVAGSRVKTATTTTIAAGFQSVSITVNAGTAGTSPTIQGAAVNTGSYSFSAQDSETLGVITVVTSTGDDVTIFTISGL